MNKVNIKIETNMGDAILYKGTPKSETPKTYKKVKVLRHDIGNRYNSDLMTLYKNRQGVYKYEIYRDGCFSPYYGTIEFIDKEK